MVYNHNADDTKHKYRHKFSELVAEGLLDSEEVMSMCLFDMSEKELEAMWDKNKEILDKLKLTGILKIEIV